MKVQVEKSDSEHCIVRIGPLTRSDPDAECHVVRSTGPGDQDWERVERVYIEGKKSIKFDLPPGEYHVMVVGNKIAGVASTAGHVLEHPWNVFLDAPADGSKQYIRQSVPTNIPKKTTVAQAVRKTLH